MWETLFKSLLRVRHLGELNQTRVSHIPGNFPSHWVNAYKGSSGGDASSSGCFVNSLLSFVKMPESLNELFQVKMKYFILISLNCFDFFSMVETIWQTRHEVLTTFSQSETALFGEETICPKSFAQLSSGSGINIL